MTRPRARAADSSGGVKGRHPGRTPELICSRHAANVVGGGPAVSDVVVAGQYRAGLLRAEAERRTRHLDRHTGPKPTPFLMTRFDERSPRFSPDGGWLAYVSDESGRDEVCVLPERDGIEG